jgi:membrane-associated phospholipid phosphatase
MRLTNSLSALAMTAIASLAAAAANAQTPANLNAFKGLAPFSALLNTPAGKAALAANLQVTGAIQNGTSGLPALQPFPQAQAQALKDADITGGNGYQLADGLGSKLGGAYQSLTKCSKTTSSLLNCTNISTNIATLIGYSFALAGADAISAKYFFANATALKNKVAKPVSPAALAIIKAEDGTTDVFGKAYGKPAGSPGADPLGDPRPFQTEPKVTKYSDPDFFGDPSDNQVYLVGPAQDLLASPAFPSGHTAYGTSESLLFAIMVPERFPQMVTRGAEYGNSRIVLGAHYAMDVIGGRTLAYYDVAQVLADKPAYLGLKEMKVTPVTDFRASLKAARADLRRALAKACGGTIAACAAEDRSRFSNVAADQAFYEATLTYGLPVVYPAQAGKTEDVAAIAPEAGTILQAAFPKLTLAQADGILTTTEGPGGGFLDNGSAFGVYSRLDLVKAGIAAQNYK